MLQAFIGQRILISIDRSCLMIDDMTAWSATRPNNPPRAWLLATFVTHTYTHPLSMIKRLAAGLIFAEMTLKALAVPRVLVYTATAGYRHDSIPTAIEELGKQQASWNVSFEFSE